MWKPDLLKRPDSKVSPWSAFWFVTFLCIMMVAGSLLTIFPSNPALPAFFSFLPVAFLMIGEWQKRSVKAVADLEQRVRALEARLAEQASGAA